MVVGGVVVVPGVIDVIAVVDVIIMIYHGVVVDVSYRVWILSVNLRIRWDVSPCAAEVGSEAEIGSGAATEAAPEEATEAAGSEVVTDGVVSEVVTEGVVVEAMEAEAEVVSDQKLNGIMMCRCFI
jgi:hypothetical protein